MEGSNDMYCKGIMLAPKKIKNRLKTPAQVQALEKVYNEHKYPSETLKLQLAKQIGLSQKQVSRWFFHRRLKERKLLQNEVSENGKQNISSSLINDHNSGVEQESCSSSKQGDVRADPTDIESKRSYGRHPSRAVLALQQKARHANVTGSVFCDSRTPGQSLEWQEQVIQQDKIPGATKLHKYFILDENQTLMKRRASKSRGLMMDSRYYFSIAGKENYVISSVKRKLGEFYCEEGPPLGVHFDPLPPGSFNSSFTDSSFESRHMGDSIQQNHLSRRKIIKGPEVYNNCPTEMLSNGSHPESDCFRKGMHGPLYPNDLTSSQLNQMPYMVKHTKIFQDRTGQVEKVEDFGRNMFDSNCRRSERCLKYRPKGGDNGAQHHFSLHDQKANTSKAFSYMHNHYNFDSVVYQDEDISNRGFVKSDNKSTDFLDSGNLILPRRTLKKEKIIKERIVDHSKKVDQEMLMTTKTGKRRKGNGTEFQQLGYAESSEKFSWMRSDFRCSVGVETSLNEHEDHGITSSID